MDGGVSCQAAATSGTVERVCSEVSRWTPTKEQINMLECVYKQGIRTPTADQIQQITNRLKTYGKIQAKNVFYWFQNHKARQRQKQKQLLRQTYFRHLLLLQNPASHPPTASYRFVTQLDGFGLNKFAANIPAQCTSSSSSVELLPLFPLEPSCTLRGRTTVGGAISHEESCSEIPYFDFFSISEGRRSNE